MNPSGEVSAVDFCVKLSSLDLFSQGLALFLPRQKPLPDAPWSSPQYRSHALNCFLFNFTKGIIGAIHYFNLTHFTKTHRTQQTTHVFGCLVELPLRHEAA